MSGAVDAALAVCLKAAFTFFLVLAAAFFGVMAALIYFAEEFRATWEP